MSSQLTVNTFTVFVLHSVPAPFVVIEAVGTPYNGSEYILTCIVTVDDSVDTNITTSSQWMMPPDTDTTDNTSSERVGELEHQHNLTFSPLRSGDSGEYTCNATITPEEEGAEFILGSLANETEDVTVQSKRLHSSGLFI